ncbi:ammonium transporter [Nocardia sp. NPDC024068]|uniref:ammonium transporter n=1 Tax=Nocardia sp. NPDC024068 TaxID=3157197 RepID=UPI0034044A47
MKIRKIAAVLAPMLATAAVGAGVVHAEPATPDIGYRTELVGKNVVTTLTNGTFALRDETVDVLDKSGATVVTLPLFLREGTTEYPLPHAVRDEGRVLELTAVKDVEHARPTLQPIASPQENLSAQNNFASQFGLATAIGGFVGTAIGALAGLAIGIGTGVVFSPATVITGATLGGIIGTIVVGGPALVISAVDLVNTLTAAPGTTQWAPKAQATR